MTARAPTSPPIPPPGPAGGAAGRPAPPAPGDTREGTSDPHGRSRHDVARLADLGVGAYRFSVAWSRVVPAGSGAVNPAGLDFYSRLVDQLLERGIRPCVT